MPERGESTITMRLTGGLGNQMFQYAFGLQLASLHGAALRLDTAAYRNDKKRRFALGCFGIEEDVATPTEESGTSAKIARACGTLGALVSDLTKPYYRRRIIRERYVTPFDPNILRCGPNVYLDGYWQSEKYFADVASQVRRTFVPLHPPSAHAMQLSEEAKRTQAVSLHVRRGDYVSDPQTSQLHNVTTLDYYDRALAIIKQKVSDPVVFVFSDDALWVKQNLRLSARMIFVAENEAQAEHDDLRLMALCQHHIITNSTFGWWGAWLNPSTDKMVIAPKKWFNDPRLDTRDVVPDRWTKI